MNRWLLPLLLLLSLGPGCIEASRPAADDAIDPADTSAPGDTASAVDADAVGPETVEPVDTLTPVEVTPSCQQDQCRIDGGCVDDGVAQTHQSCHVCDVSRDALGWSRAAAATPCDDADACTPSSACTEDGRCVGAPDPVCAEPPDCVKASACGDGACSYNLEPGTCLIAGHCYQHGDLLAAGGCQTCDPMLAPFAWTARTSGDCDDDDACTQGDSCGEGGVCAGVQIDCDDHVECTVDSCKAGGCRNEVGPESCYIDAVCYEETDLSHGVNGVQCGVCDSAANASDWSSGSGDSCDDGDACTTDDTCDDGVCLGIPDTIDGEPNDTPDSYQHVSVNAIHELAGFPSGSLDGNLNPEGDQDYYGYGMLMNTVAVKRKPKVELSQLDQGIAYELCIWARCGVDDASAQPPTVNCPVGDSVPLEGGKFVGCCNTVAGVTSFGASLQASCSDDPVSTDTGVVLVRVQATPVSAGACPGYILEWGAVSY